MTTAPGITPARLDLLDEQLTERERDILTTLAKLRLACTRQLEQLHFTEASPLANARHARRVLAKLADLHLVSRLERRVGGVKAGSAGYVWSLGTGGQQLLGGRGPAGGKSPRTPWTPSRAFLTHRLSISELYVELTLAERSGRLELMRFDPEPACWRYFTGPHGAPANLKPDAYVQIAVDDYLDSYFVEIDLGTESMPVIARKAVACRTYWQTGREQAKSDGVFPLVAFLIPTAARANMIRAVLGQQPADFRRIFRVALRSEAVGLLTSGGAA